MDDLGTALRSWRDRLDPLAVGLTHNVPRRAPGCDARNWRCWPATRSYT
jgi:hypothetical protein